MKTVRHYFIRFIPSLREIALIRGGPTARRQTSGLTLVGFAVAALVAVTSPAPEISLSLRGVGDGIVEQGEPLRAVVRLRAPRDAKSEVTLSPVSGTWADAIRVEISPAAGGAVLAQAEAVGQPDAPAVSLDKTRTTGGLWHFSADAMQRLEPGNYMVRSRLTIAAGPGWTGEIVSAPTPLRVVAASNVAERVTQRAVNRAHDALLAGRVEEAAAILDAVLINLPDDGRLLLTRAVVSERAGNIVAAILCANRGERARSLTSKGPPPLELEELQGRLRTTMPTAMARGDKPAEWSWPPKNVMTLPPSMILPPAAKSSPAPFPVAAAPIALNAIPASVSAVATVSPSVLAPAPKPANPPASLPVEGEIVPGVELTDAKILPDPAGQWAEGAVAGSQYSSSTYSAAKATGAPDVPVTGDSPSAWCPGRKNDGTEWLELSFAKPVRATAVRIRQSNCQGAIVKIEAFEADGTAHVWWEGADTYKPSAVREIVWCAVRVPKTGYPVAKVKITLNLAAVPGWKQIDAVQLVGAVE